MARGGPTDAARLDSRRVFILPTRSGLGFSLLLMVMLLGAVNYNNNLAYALTFLLAGLGWVTMHHTYRNLAGLQLGVGQSEPGFSGGEARFQIWLANPRGPDRVAVRLQPVQGRPLQSHAPRDRRTSLWLTVPAKRRGLLHLGRIKVSTEFPLGLFHAWSYVELEHQTLVYPRPAPAGRPLPVSPRKASEVGDQGRGTDDFRGFRNYHAGDSLRHVNWKAVAREQGWLTKEFGGDRIEELWLDWQALGDLDNEARLRQLCRWVLDAARDRRFFGLRLPGAEIPPGTGPLHRDRCLAALARFGESS